MAWRGGRSPRGEGHVEGENHALLAQVARPDGADGGFNRRRLARGLSPVGRDHVVPARRCPALQRGGGPAGCRYSCGVQGPGGVVVVKGGKRRRRW